MKMADRENREKDRAIDGQIDRQTDRQTEKDKRNDEECVAYYVHVPVTKKERKEREKGNIMYTEDREGMHTPP